MTSETRYRVVATAGHVDHGKSTLVRALTGVDPDRLREEQDRQMTIDLGFGWLELPSGTIVGIVDVPGHRDFIHNMLAGVGGVDAVMLVVAADDGIMPQTREHIAILDLLHQAGLVVITGRPGGTRLAGAGPGGCSGGLAGTVLADAPMVVRSTRGGTGGSGDAGSSASSRPPDEASPCPLTPSPSAVLAQVTRRSQEGCSR